MSFSDYTVRLCGMKVQEVCTVAQWWHYWLLMKWLLDRWFQLHYWEKTNVKLKKAGKWTYFKDRKKQHSLMLMNDDGMTKNSQLLMRCWNFDRRLDVERTNDWFIACALQWQALCSQFPYYFILDKIICEPTAYQRWKARTAMFN